MFDSFKKKICPDCGHTGRARSLPKVNFALELILWIAGILSLFTIALAWFIVVPIIYSLWRMLSRTPVCSKCNHPGVIPLDSPKGKQLAAEYGVR